MPRANSFASPDGPIFDPVCVFHGKKHSEHDCLYCCLCFRDLTPAECTPNAAGVKEDVCAECRRAENMAGESGSSGSEQPPVS